METPRFKGVCLISDDVCELSHFYAEILRTEVQGDAIHALIETSGASLTMGSIALMEEMAPGSTQHAGRGSTVLEFIVEDVDAEYERLLALGVPIVKPPKSYPWGTRSVWFRDPDGNIVNFVYAGGR